MKLSFSVLLILSLSLPALAGCIGGGGKGDNQGPVAALTATQGSPPTAVTLDGTGSSDPDGDALRYEWNWVLGNATTSDNRIEVEFPSILATKNASFTVALTVVDPDGETAIALAAVVFGDGRNAAPQPKIRDATRWVESNKEVLLDASISDDADDDPLYYEWIWGPRASYEEEAHALDDACAQASSADLQGFSTGCLTKGQSYPITFNLAGTYTFHCHPHPWMKGRLIVDPNSSATDPVTIDIQNFRYGPERVTVGVGTQVTWLNLDPDPHKHTATLEDYVPGTGAGGTTPVFRQTLAEGEYVVRLIVTDGKGGRATQTWGLKASNDAVPNPLVNTTDEPDDAMLQGQVRNVAYNTTFVNDVQATLETNDGGSNLSNMTFQLGTGEGTNFAAQGQCPATKGTGEDQGKYFIACKIPRGDYNLRVQVQTGAILGWKLTVTAIPYSFPPFGDSSGDAHAHH